MHTTIGWGEVSIRLLLTVIAGGLIGMNRGGHGQSAGLRTHILVCLAASVSMIQANFLLATVGRQADSFVMLDLMRLPLGILTGMGFIGAGAILRRGQLIAGITTAATLWFVTVMGLCLGGGQTDLGLAMLGIGLVVLSVMKWGEKCMNRDRRSVLILAMQDDGPDEEQIRSDLRAAKFRIKSCAVSYATPQRLRKMRCELQWRGRLDDSQTPEVVRRLIHAPGVVRLQWRP